MTNDGFDYLKECIRNTLRFLVEKIKEQLVDFSSSLLKKTLRPGIKTLHIFFKIQNLWNNNSYIAMTLK